MLNGVPNALIAARKILKRASGYFLTKSKLYQAAQEAVERGLKFAYTGRKQKKRQYRSLVDRTHRCGCPSERHELFDVHKWPEAGRQYAGSQDPRRTSPPTMLLASPRLATRRQGCAPQGRLSPRGAPEDRCLIPKTVRPIHRRGLAIDQASSLLETNRYSEAMPPTHNSRRCDWHVIHVRRACTRARYLLRVLGPLPEVSRPPRSHALAAGLSSEHSWPAQRARSRSAWAAATAIRACSRTATWSSRPR